MKNICVYVETTFKKNSEFETTYDFKKSYTNYSKPFCHLCFRENCFWNCSTCQYNICKGCRDEEMGDIEPS